MLLGGLGLSTALAAGPTWGEHGMVLFGDQDGLYASHLPMLHAPHDYQVLLRLHVADARLDAALRQRLAGKPVLWTIAPEAFELQRLAPRSAHPLTQFKADLVLGHFEQKGHTEYAAATLVVEQVLLFRQLATEAKNNASASYMQIGGGAQRFLVKRIDSRPDFEHIVSFTAKAGAPTGPVTVPKQALRQPAQQALAAALLPVLGAPPTMRGAVYFSTDDLQ